MAGDAEVLEVHVTGDDRAVVDGLVRGAVERRLAACGQVVGPVTSTYRWEGRVTTDEEWLALLKTSAARVDELIAWLVAEHPYDEPEVLALPVAAGSAGYLAWVVEETRPAG